MSSSETSPDYMRPLEGDSVGGETVALISEKWPHSINPEDDYQGELKDEPPEKTPPWDEHVAHGRQELLSELQLLVTHSFRATKWAETQTDLPDGLLTDIRAVAEKLRQTVRTLS